MAFFSRAGFLAGLIASWTLGCGSGAEPQEGNGGAAGSLAGSGGEAHSGGTTGSGGAGSGGKGSGGSVGSGGVAASGGATSKGGQSAGGSTHSGGAIGPGGTIGSGGVIGSGGPGRTGGALGTGGLIATGGRPGTGGLGAGGNLVDAGGTAPAGLDCTNIPAMPSGGVDHTGNSQGGKDNLAWQIWSNGGSGTLTTFSTPAFIAKWNNSGDYLGRLGYEWGNAGKAYTAYGTIKADVAFKKSGTAGQYSYVGIYGWSTNPCIEWYIVDDSFQAMPFNTGDPVSGTFDLDGGTYNLVKRHTSGTGGNRCGNVSSWDQFYSIRKTGRQCGTISISEHFKTWDAKGWKLGNLLEVKILVEAAGGQGSVEFPVANVTTSQ